MKNKVVLVGCGNVGMSFAYALVNQQTYVDELVLIDIDEEKIIGEAMDLNHSLPYCPSKLSVKIGKYEDCADARIVVIAAGSNQAPGETRMDLIHKNSRIFKSIIDPIMASNFNGIFIVATNPLDVMTYLTLKYSKLPVSRVIGSGTTLDTARLRYMISDKIKIASDNIEAYVIGEHGDSEFVPWSNASIGLTSIDNFLTKEDMESIEKDVRESAYEIIKRKGATYYGIGAALAKITKAILEDKNEILSVSSYDTNNDVCISTPAIVGASGVKRKIHIPLNQEETQKLTYSINVIKDAIKSIE
ncbi:MAG: L-lactate dehydrogenase [Erysipelotrichales bacterium]|nr:L-lactate dehydrogenase [Erysipelotrichales bacterium]